MREHQSGIDPPNREGLKATITALRAGFPDLRLSVEDAVAVGDTVWGRLRCTGTHRGVFMGIPPTARGFETTAIDVCRFEGGRIVEHWGVPDRMGMMEQLGLVPRPPMAPRASP